MCDQDQDVLWHFEDLKLLNGTDLPIFGGDTYPCLSLQLRSMKEPIRVLSGIDYWLDNLMAYVPEVTMCYHSNCFVQKHELVMNEDLPSLNDSTRSSKVITRVAQNVLSFLKSNTAEPGHTYWLFKGDNDDIVKFYDLSSLCSESLVEEYCEGQNLFTIPVAMLLYHVALNLKYNPIDEMATNTATIQILLNNCLKLLNKTKYPHIVISVHLMLSDFYIPNGINPASVQLANNALLSPYVKSDENLSISSDVEKSMFSIELENPPSKIIVMTLEEHCQKALYYVGCGISCLYYSEDTDQQLTMKKGRKTKNNKNKNKNHNKGCVIVEYNEDFKNNPLLNKSVAEIMPSWHNPPNPQDNDFWKQRLNILFYQKACLVYDILAKYYLAHKKYGKVIKHYCYSFKCWLWIFNTKFNRTIIGMLLKDAADCCFYISQNWDKVQQYRIELDTDDKCDLKIRSSLLDKFDNSKLQDFNLIPRNIESKEGILNAAVNCYKRSLEYEIDQNEKNILNRQLGNIYNKLSTEYIDEIITAWRIQSKITTSRLKWLLKTSRNYLSIGIKKSERSSDQFNLALLYANMGHLYRYTLDYLLQNNLSTTGFIKDKDFTKMAIESYEKGLTALGNRSFDQNIWDKIFFDVSTVTYNMTIKYKNNPPVYSKLTEAINVLLEALKYCDLENEVSQKSYYEYRAADIHDHLGSLYYCRLRNMDVDMPMFKTTINQCKSHYNQSFEIFFKMKRPLECIEVLMKDIAVDELQIESIKYLVI
uniref:Erythroid differentiation-related factor 1 n=1 Tax=Schizaphis graminum TaxID=13262 RepID=A0A2S2PJZ7_SCHGA